MKRLIANFICLIFVFSLLLAIAGCSKSSASHKKRARKQTASVKNGTETKTSHQTVENKQKENKPNQYPDIPTIPIMTKVDGISIPRLETKIQSLSTSEKIPVDVDNESAKNQPGKPVTGGELTIRFSSEPNTFNPITENSAVRTYMWEYVGEALVRQNPETLEYEPWLAKSWVVEDSVKLSPDYPGKERRLAQLEFQKWKSISYKERTPEEKKAKKKQQVIEMTTVDDQKKVLANVWVVLFAAEKISGFPLTGRYFQSDNKGKLSLFGLKTGEYNVFIGKEKKLISAMTFSYKAFTAKEKKEQKEKENPKRPQIVDIITKDSSGKTLGKVWVGLFAESDIPGFPVTGQHYWSNEKGKLTLLGLKTGKYKVYVGAEFAGKTTKNKNGSLTIKPLAFDNPLQASLKASKKKEITIPKKDWFNVQRETIYTYALNENAKWSDGKPFTSKDIEFAYAVLNNEFVDGDATRVYYSDVISCKGSTAHSVRIQYRQQYFQAFQFTYALSALTPPFHQFQQYIKTKFGNELTMEKLTPEQEDQQHKISVYGQRFGKYFNTNDTYNIKPLGTGPYVVKKWVRKNSVILERNSNYWGKTHRGYLDRLTFKFISDSSTAMQALKSGEIDFFWGVSPPQYYETLKGPPQWFKEKYVKASWFSPGFAYIGWNMLKPKFQDRRVRLALSLLFDASRFVEKKLHGDGVLVSGSQYYFGVAYDYSVKPIGYAPEIASQLLANAGWIDSDGDGILDKDGKPFVFEFWFPKGGTIMGDQIAIIQKNFKSAGIVMHPRNLEWASFLEKIKSRDFDVCRLGWATSLESDPFQIWHSSEAGKGKRGSNHVSFANPEADKLIETLRYTLDLKKRVKIHSAFQRILDREQPYLFLYTSKAYGAYNQKYRGVKWYRQRPGFNLSEWYIPKELQ